MNKGIGELFQEQTKYFRGKLPHSPLFWQSRPDLYKNYPEAVRINLPAPHKNGGLPLWEAIRRRRSIRDFNNRPLETTSLSQLLWASQGITSEYMGYKLRSAPSAGALYPVETYTIIHRVEGIESGVYHYAVLNHQLEQLKTGDFRHLIAEAALEQDMVRQANVVFAWTAVFARSKWKYSQRAYRYVYLDAGHIAQNLALAAVSLGLGCCPIAALYDDEVNEIIGVGGSEESVLYLSAVGYPR